MATTVITTPRLRLCPLAVSDAADLLPTLSHPDVMRWTPQAPRSSMAEAEQWVREHKDRDNSFNFTVRLAGPDEEGFPKNECIGIMGSHSIPQIGYLIHPDHAGKGYATEALNALVAALFEFMPSGLDKASSSEMPDDIKPGLPAYDYVEARVNIENTASCRVLEKCGFSLWETRTTEQKVLLRVYRLARAGCSLTEQST